MTSKVFLVNLNSLVLVLLMSMNPIPKEFDGCVAGTLFLLLMVGIG